MHDKRPRMEEKQQSNAAISTVAQRKLPIASLPTEVRHLPAGLIGRALIQHLPWRKRVQVEGVCRLWQSEALAYGWEDMQWLSWDNGRGETKLNSTSWLPLLTRAGPHLTTLELGAAQGRELEGDMLCEGLANCPRLKHLSMRWGQLSDPVLHYFGRETPPALPKLKSIQLFATGSDRFDGDNGSVQERKTMTSRLNDAISSFPSLEYLQVEGWHSEVWKYEGGLRFSALHQYGNIRRLALYFCRHSILSTESLNELAAIPTLRSFTMRQRTRFLVENLSFLKRFIHLEHLEIAVVDRSCESFVEALPHLDAGGLKALELDACFPMAVQGSRHSAVLGQLLPAIAAHLHELEHLGFRVYAAYEAELGAIVEAEAEEVVRVLADSLPQLESLRSLAFLEYVHMKGETNMLPPHGQVDWSWLEELCRREQCRLEYLEVCQTLPHSTIGSIARNCKRLRCLRLRQAQWTTEDLAAIVEAAAHTTTIAAGGVGVEGSHEALLPSNANPPSSKLLIPFYGVDLLSYDASFDHDSIEILLENGGTTTTRLLQFENLYELPRKPNLLKDIQPKVLNHYRHGCLSEGECPLFEP